MGAPRVFLSHATPDADFANRLAVDLRRLGADVWLDSSHIGGGDFVTRINEALGTRDFMVLVLSPSAIQSPWVTQEVSAAVTRSNQGLMRPPVVVMAQPCSLSAIPPLWTVYHRHDATRDYASALAGVAQEIGLGSQEPPNPVLPLPPLMSSAPGFAPGTERVIAAVESTSASQSAPISRMPLRAGIRSSELETHNLTTLFLRSLAIASIVVSIVAIIIALAYHGLPNTQQSLIHTAATPTATTSDPAVALFDEVTARAPTLSDSLENQDTNQWETTSPTASGACYFSGGVYHATQHTPGFRTQCRLLSRTLSRFALRVNMTIQAGKFAGVDFDVSQNDALNIGYRFEVDVNGSWSLIAASGTNPRIMSTGTAANFQRGYGQVNTPTVIVANDHIYLFMNSTPVSTIGLDQSEPSSGLVGMYVFEQTQPTEADYNNLTMWAL